MKRAEFQPSCLATLKVNKGKRESEKEWLSFFHIFEDFFPVKMFDSLSQ